MKTTSLLIVATVILALGAAGLNAEEPIELSESQMQELVLRSYPYGAMFNVNNKFALDVDHGPSGGETEVSDRKLRNCYLSVFGALCDKNSSVKGLPRYRRK